MTTRSTRFLDRIRPDSIVDMHVHMLSLVEEEGNYISKELQSGVVYQYLMRNLGLANRSNREREHHYVHKLKLCVMDDEPPDLAVLLALDWVYDDQGERDKGRSHLVVSNDTVLRVCREHPEFLPAASVNPQRRDAFDELERMAEAGAVALKVLPNLQGFDPANPAYRPFWRRLAELGLPLLSHTGYEHALPSISDDYGDPRRLIPALEEGCTVIAAHCAAAGTFHAVEYFDHFTGMLPRYPRLYGDISGFASPIRRTYVEPMLGNSLRRRRVLVGSDFPIPCLPMVFLKELGLSKARELAFDPNPLRRNARLFRALGADDEVLQRAARVLLGLDQPPAADAGAAEADAPAAPRPRSRRFRS